MPNYYHYYYYNHNHHHCCRHYYYTITVIIMMIVVIITLLLLRPRSASSFFSCFTRDPKVHTNTHTHYTIFLTSEAKANDNNFYHLSLLFQEKMFVSSFRPTFFLDEPAYALSRLMRLLS